MRPQFEANVALNSKDKNGKTLLLNPNLGVREAIGLLSLQTTRTTPSLTSRDAGKMLFQLVYPKISLRSKKPAKVLKWKRIILSKCFRELTMFSQWFLYTSSLLHDGQQLDPGGHGGLRAVRAGGDHQVGGLLHRGLRHCRCWHPRQPRQPRGPHQTQPQGRNHNHYVILICQQFWHNQLIFYHRLMNLVIKNAQTDIRISFCSIYQFFYQKNMRK